MDNGALPKLKIYVRLGFWFCGECFCAPINVSKSETAGPRGEINANRAGARTHRPNSLCADAGWRALAEIFFDVVTSFIQADF